MLQLATLLAQEETFDYTYSLDPKAAEAAGAAVAGIAGVMVFVWVLLILFALVGFVIWLWAIIDCAKRQFTNPADRTTWLIVLIVGFLFGISLIVAIIYLIVGRKKGEIPGAAAPPPPGPTPPETPPTT